MQDHEIDKMFRKQLEGYAKQPSPEAWDKLEAALHPRKRRLVVAWRMAAGVALFAGLLGIGRWYLATPTTNDIIANKQVLPIAKPTDSTEKLFLPATQAQAKQLVATTNNAKYLSDTSKVSDNAKYLSDTSKVSDKWDFKSGEGIAKNEKAGKKTIQRVYLSDTSKVSDKWGLAKVEQNQTVEIENIAQNKQVVQLPIEPTNEQNVQNKQENATIVAKNATATEEESNAIEVVVKVDNLPTTTQTEEVAPKKRKFFGRILNKLKEGEALTLKDVGVNTAKLPKFLQRENSD